MKAPPVQHTIYRNQRLQALTLTQAQTIDAIAARIFPTTDTPGAVEAGAMFYLIRRWRARIPNCFRFMQRRCAPWIVMRKKISASIS